MFCKRRKNDGVARGQAWVAGVSVGRLIAGIQCRIPIIKKVEMLLLIGVILLRYPWGGGKVDCSARNLRFLPMHVLSFYS